MMIWWRRIFDMKKMLKGKKPERNSQPAPGDLVFVPQNSIFQNRAFSQQTGL